VKLHLHAGLLQAGDEAAAFLDQIGVEGAGEPAVGRQHQYGRAPDRSRLTQQREALGQFRRVKVRDHLAQRARVRARREDTILRALHLRRRDHLHRTRDLPRVLDGLDAPLELAAFSHSRYR